MKKLLTSPLFVIIAGLLTQEGSDLASIMPVLLVVILFISFLSFETRELALNEGNSHLLILAMFAMGMIIYIVALTLTFSNSVALAGLLLCFTPTAISAPAITSALKGNKKIVSLNVIYTNLSFSVVFVFIIMLISSGHALNVLKFDVVLYTLLIIVTPFLVSRIFRKKFPLITAYLIARNSLPMYLWLTVIFVASSSVGKNLLSRVDTFKVEIIYMFFTSMFVFFLSLFVGTYCFKKHKIEMSQSLAQKNTIISLWIAINYLPDPISIAPIFYSLIQNIWYSLFVNIEDQ